MATLRHRWFRILGILAIVTLAFAASFFLADYVASNGSARELVERFGYAGILAISVVSGLNLFIPVPAAAFVPVFTAAGFSMPGIITTLIVGTLIADWIGYLLGVAGRHATELHYPKFQKKLRRFAKRHHALILPGVFLYAAFSPFPNEIVLAPLALIGTRFRALFLPLLLGTIAYQILYAYGAQGIFDLFF